eukprot:6465025-Amphidinium_carterae.1
MAAPAAKTGKLERLPSKRQMVCAEEKAKKTVEKTLEMRAAERVETRISEIGQVLRTDLGMLEKVYSLVFDGDVLKMSEVLPPEWPVAYKHLRRATNQVLVDLFTGACADIGRPLLALVAAKDPEGLSKILYTVTHTEASHGLGPRGIEEWKKAYERRMLDCGNLIQMLPSHVHDGIVNTQRFGVYLLMPEYLGKSEGEEKQHRFERVRCGDFEIALSDDIVVTAKWRIECNWSVRGAIITNPSKSLKLNLYDLMASCDGFQDKMRPFYDSPAAVYAQAKAKAAKGKKRKGGFSPRTPKKRKTSGSEAEGTPRSSTAAGSVEPPTSEPPEDVMPDVFLE